METSVLEILSESRDQTFEAGRAMARFLESGDVVALTGELGSGKTVFAQGVCDGLEVTDPVTSPTFTLVQEYTGRLPVRHFDFYRLESAREIEDLDLEGYFQSGGVCLIEWAERGRMFYPEEHFKVELSRVFETGRPHADRRRIRIEHPVHRMHGDFAHDRSGD
jgi:tRNA threonylcarbamoyladenosine biosynthesis protein TsaE